MELYIQKNGGGKFCMEVSYFATVAEIKKKIEKLQGIPISKQTLIFNDTILHDDLNVHHSDILDRSRLLLEVASDFPPPPLKLRLYIRMPPPSGILTLELDSGDTILRLKEKIHEIVDGAPVTRLSIHANGSELPDHSTLLQCDLSDNSEVSVAFRPTGGIRVVAKYGAEMMVVEVSAAETVGELRRKLDTLKMNLPQQGYFFIHKQTIMEDDRPFRWYHVAHNDTIDIFSGTISSGS